LPDLREGLILIKAKIITKISINTNKNITRRGEGGNFSFRMKYPDCIIPGK